MSQLLATCSNAALPLALDELYPHLRTKERDSESEEESSEDSEFDIDPDVQLMEVKVSQFSIQTLSSLGKR